jgi:RHS repeat-associated protein
VDTSTSVTKLWTYQGNNIASVSTKSGGSFGDTSTQEWVYTVAPGLINNVLERHKANYASATTTSEYYQYDHRGNVAAVTDYSGKILRGYQYDAFGNIPFSFATGQSGAAPTDDILFTGKDLDPDSGFYYFNVRWYDAGVGRFVSRAEPRVDRELLYGLCEGNPISNTDSSGRLVDQNCLRTYLLAVLIIYNLMLQKGDIKGAESINWEHVYSLARRECNTLPKNSFLNADCCAACCEAKNDVESRLGSFGWQCTCEVDNPWPWAPKDPTYVGWRNYGTHIMLVCTGPNGESVVHNPSIGTCPVTLIPW